MNSQVSRWRTHPHFLGSYSYQSVDSARAGLGPSDLAAPLWGGRLRFAGEASHPRHFSTVHGAMDAGRREAEGAMEVLANNK